VKELQTLGRLAARYSEPLGAKIAGYVATLERGGLSTLERARQEWALGRALQELEEMLEAQAAEEERRPVSV
jgi:hypothetical protein